LPETSLRVGLNSDSERLTPNLGILMKSENTIVESRNEISSQVELYQKPRIRELDEKEVLSAFQVTVAAATWWVM
jgi:hypothetical protein